VIEIEFLGAAQEVTGSMHLVHTPQAKVLLDCGLFQGRRKESVERNHELRVPAHEVDAVVLSHAHIDHSGALPVLTKSGYKGNIYMTPATRDLCAAMLEDSAMIQAHDAEYIARRIEREGSDMEPVTPLYDMDDVIRTLSQTLSIPYHRRTRIAPGVDLTFFDAGHVLGSALVQLDVDVDGRNERILFTGDLGRRHMPILRDPECPSGVNVLIMESTYGDRDHPPIERLDDDLGQAVRDTVARGGRVIVPSFALERAQEIVYALKRLHAAGALPDVPVFVDSPLTVRLTDVFRMHPECYDRSTRDVVLRNDSPFDFDGLTYVTSPEESKRVSAMKGSAVVIAASGMAEYGRVLHHLRSGVEDERNTILIVGFQAQHTLGRRLVEGRTRVRIFGVERERRAQVVVLNGFSAHADRNDLVAFAEALRNTGSLRQVLLVHGEPPSQQALSELLGARAFPSVHIPSRGERVRV